MPRVEKLSLVSNAASYEEDVNTRIRQETRSLPYNCFQSSRNESEAPGSTDDRKHLHAGELDGGGSSSPPSALNANWATDASIIRTQPRADGENISLDDVSICLGLKGIRAKEELDVGDDTFVEDQPCEEFAG